MKRVIVVDERGYRLLNDPINRSIVTSCIRTPKTVKGISQLLNIPFSTAWRRVRELQENGILEVEREEGSKNIRVKMYRAKATLFMGNEFTLLGHVRSEDLKDVAVKYYGLLRKEYEKLVEEFNKIPEGVDPIDYSLWVDLYINVRLQLDQEMRREVTSILQSLYEIGKETGYIGKPPLEDRDS